MIAGRRLDSQHKHQRVIATVDARLATGHELSVAGIARQAGVSRKVIYAHPELRAEIEQRASRSATTGATDAAADARVTIASLRAGAANANAQNSRLREQLRSLEHRPSETLGREIASQIDPVGHEHPDQLRTQLEAAHASAFELEEALAHVREELEAGARSTANSSPDRTAPDPDSPPTRPRP